MSLTTFIIVITTGHHCCLSTVTPPQLSPYCHCLAPISPSHLPLHLSLFPPPPALPPPHVANSCLEAPICLWPWLSSSCCSRIRQHPCLWGSRTNVWSASPAGTVCAAPWRGLGITFQQGRAPSPHPGEKDVHAAAPKMQMGQPGAPEGV